MVLRVYAPSLLEDKINLDPSKVVKHDSKFPPTLELTLIRARSGAINEEDRNVYIHIRLQGFKSYHNIWGAGTFDNAKKYYQSISEKLKTGEYNLHVYGNGEIEFEFTGKGAKILNKLEHN